MAAPRAPAVSPLGITWIGMSACSSRWTGMAGAGLADEPALEVLAGFQRAAADDQRVGVERVHHLVEEQAERVGLHAEDIPAQRIAASRPCRAPVSPPCAGRQLAELVAGIARQEVRQQRFLDGGERAERFQVAGAAAVALRLRFPRFRRCSDRESARGPSSPPKPAAALDHIAVDDDAAAESGADDRRRSRSRGCRAEDREVSPKRAGVAVVEVGDRAGRASLRGSARMSNPAQSGWTKLVEPRALSTPAALAGPGVSSPTATTSSRRMPALSAAIFRPSSICCRQTSGPCFESAGCSHSPSMRNCSSSLTNV